MAWSDRCGEWLGREFSTSGFLALGLWALGLAGATPATAVVLPVPEVALRVIDHETGAPVPGVVAVQIIKPGKWQTEGRSRATARTDANGWVRFAPLGVDHGDFMALRLSWETPGLPSREVLYQFKVRKGERTRSGRALRIGSQTVFYLVRDSLDGSCENLFERSDSSERVTLTFRRPASFSDCEQAHLSNVDIRNVGQRDINADNWNFYPFERDLLVGRQFAQQVGAEQPPLDDAVVTGYVEDLVARLGRASDMPDLPYHVQVIDADVLNAFALPGGHIFVYRGLIEATETEAELVGVLAHEIAHVTGRHGTEGMSSTMRKIGLAMLAGALLVDDDDDLTQELVFGGILAGAQLWVLKGDRKQEAEADRLGAQYAQRAGYDPRGIATFFERLSQQRDTPQGRFDQLFAEHPNDDVRVANIEEMVAYFLPPGGRLVTSSPEYLKVKKRLSQLPPPRVGGEAAGQLFDGLRATNQRILWEEISVFLEEGDPDSVTDNGP